MTEKQLAQMLVQAGLVTPQQVQQAAQRRGKGVGIAQALVEMNAVQAVEILQVDPGAFERLPGVPAAPAGQAPQAAQAAPQARPAVGLGQGAAPALDDSGVRFEGINRSDGDGSIAGFVVTACNELLKIAVSWRASDLHLEPREHGLLPRYRIDGQLRAGELLPAEMMPPMISRFKVLGGLDITENRLPQDGRFRATIGGHLFDFRVSSMPSVHGEKIVIRLLDRTALVTDLTRLGFSDEHLEMFQNMLSRSYGMILVTGPTGSGKTTTLYAALAAARDETKNVVTVEDPVEYELDGVTQTHINAEIGLTFAVQLRAILRQDPDVILVGEIRDDETAEVAVRAALTGHLLLSTLHTNSAVAAITRLQDMGVPPFLIASSLSGIVAQRLVRLICRNCREQVPLDDIEYQEAALRLRLPQGTVIYRGAGCAECGETGTRGRIALVEMLNINSDLRRAIVAHADSDVLTKIAAASGMKSLWQDGMEKLAEGLTTADEIARVLLGAQGIEE